jgi:hypothetical protein
MCGKLISGVIKIATLPIDIVESGFDVVTGGDGSKKSKEMSDMPRIGALRDGLCKGIEDALDDKNDK